MQLTSGTVWELVTLEQSKPGHHAEKSIGTARNPLSDCSANYVLSAFKKSQNKDGQG